MNPYLFKLFPIPALQDYIFFGLFFIVILILWIYLFYYFLAVKRKIKSELKEEFQLNFKEGVSIIIAARNEKQNLHELIPLLLEQDYPKFEIVVADDGSWDETGAWLIPQTELNSKLKYVFLDPEFLKMSGKKFALTMGVKKASFQYFLFIDADCRPASNQWLAHMANQFSEQNTELVIGYSPFTKEKGFLNALSRFENVQTALMYLGMGIRKKPYMGVGRNMAYSKKLYNSVGGFSSHAHLQAGDDDLFVQETANSENTGVVVHPDAFVFTNTKNNFKAYWRQKKRHNYIGKFYNSASKTRLGLFVSAQFFFWVFLGLYFFFASSWIYPILILILRMTIEWPVYYSCAKFLGQKSIAGAYPFWILYQTFFQIGNGIASYFTKKVKW